MKILKPVVLFDSDSPNGESKSEPDNQLGQINELLEYQGAAVVEKKAASADDVVDDTPAVKAATQDELKPEDLIQKVDLKNVAETEPTPVDEEGKEEKDEKVETKDEKKTKGVEEKEEEVEAKAAEGEEAEETETVEETEESGPGLFAELERLSIALAKAQAAVPITTPAVTEQKSVGTAVEQTSTAAIEEVRPAIVDLVTDESLADVLTAEGLNKFGNDVVARANTVAVQTLIPAFRKMIVSYYNIAESSRDFYNTNPELADKKSYVNLVMNEIAAEKPELKPNLSKLLEATKKEVNRRLKMRGQQETQPKGDVKTRKKVATPVTKTTTKTRGVPAVGNEAKTGGQQGQMDTMLKSFL